MKPRFLSVLVPLCLSSVFAWAQPAVAPKPQAPITDLKALPTTPAPRSAAIAKIQKLYQSGLYRQMIETATTALDNGEKPERTLLYWRAYAYRRLILLDAAKKDLEALGDFALSPKWTPASTLLAQVNELLALRPTREYLVQQGGKVLFRVYSSEDDEFLRSVLDALPKGYKAASSFTGLETDEVPVFVFNTAHFDDFTKFFGTLSGRPVRTWYRTITLSGTITVSQKSERSQPRLANDPKMVRTLSHEMTHQLIRGYLGNRVSIPNWFTEGIAQFCEGIAEPEVYTQNDRLMQRLVGQNAVLPLDKLLLNKEFQDTVDQQKEGTQKGSPYGQGLNMTRYLVVLLKDQTIPTFLAAFKEKGTFDAALEAGTGLTMDRFYASWLDTVKPRNDTNPLPGIVLSTTPKPLPVMP